MDRLYLISWYYNPTSSSAENFFAALKAGIETGKEFPMDCPYQVALLEARSPTHWAVGILAMRGTPGDDSLEQTEKLNAWFDACDVYPGSDKTGMPATAPSVEGTLRNKYGGSYQVLDTFGTL